MSTVGEVLETHTPQQRESRYRAMVKAIAAGRRHEPDPAIVEQSGRFECDLKADLDRAKRRYRAVQEIEEAEVELKRLAENPPPPRPQRSDLVSSYATLGELLDALDLVRSPATMRQVDMLHSQARSAAKTKKAHALGFLRVSADKSLDQRDRSARQEIARAQQVVADKANLKAKRDELMNKINKARVATEEEKAAALATRREHAGIVRRLESIKEIDREAITRLQGEIEKVAELQLNWEEMQFTEPTPGAASERPDSAVPRGG